MATTNKTIHTNAVNPANAGDRPMELAQAEIAQAQLAQAALPVLRVTQPAPGERGEYTVEPGQRVVMEGIDLTTARIEQMEGGLLITMPDGGVIFLAGFVEAAGSAQPPVVEIAGLGTLDAGQLLAAATTGATDLQPAAGPADGPGAGPATGGADSAGARFGAVDVGPIGNGLNRLGLLGPADFNRTPPEPEFGAQLVDSTAAPANVVFGIERTSQSPSIREEGSEDESGDSATFTISVTGNLPTGTTASVVVTPSGAATDGTDYSAIDNDIANAIAGLPLGHGLSYNSATHTLTFTGGGQTSLSFFVTALDDSLVEGTENIILTLSDATVPGGSAVIDTASATVDIIESDRAVLTIGDATAEEGNNLVFNLSLSNPSVEALTFQLSSAGSGTNAATAGTDYNTAFEYSTDGGATWTAAASNQVTFAAGDTTMQVRLATTEDSIYEPDETLTVSASVVSGTATASDTGLGTITDNDAAPAFSINDVTVSEADGTITFTVTKSGATALSSSVDYAVNPGTAGTPGDYTAGTSALTGTLNFLAGETTKTITLNVVNDTVFENTETFVVDLSGAVNATISDAQGIGTITDNDAAPAFSINDVTVSEADGTITFTVTKSGATALSSSVDYAVNPGTAGTPGDYTAGTSALTGTLTFLAGETTKTITLNVVNDTVFENTETFVVDLSGAVNATISDAQGIGTITDNDAAPAFSINDVTVSEADGTITFTVTKSGATALSSSVDYAVNPGTAGTPGDYTAGTSALTGTLTFLAGETTKTITLNVVNDTVFENTETFVVDLSGAVNATISDAQGIGTITDNDTAVLTIGDATAAEGEYLVFNLTLSNASSVSQTFQLTAASGTATAGTDFTTQFEYFNGTSWVTATSNQVTLAAGVTSMNVRVLANTDAINEPDETMTVSASVVGGLPVTTTDTGTGTITDHTPNILDGTLITNSNNTSQLVTLTFVEQTDPTHAAAKIYDLNLQGQQGSIVQDVGFNISQTENYMVSLEAASGTKAIVTNFSLEGVTIQGSGNAQLEKNDTSSTSSTSTAFTAIIDPNSPIVQGKTLSTDGDSSVNIMTDTGTGTYNYLYGASGNDTLNGSADADILNGGPGRDTLNGNGGNDILVYDKDNNDIINGGDGFDILRVDDGAIALTNLGSATTDLNYTHQQTIDLLGKSISNIEAILITEEAGASTSGVDMNDDVGTTIILDLQSVIDYTDSNNILYILGSPGDQLQLQGSSNWNTAGATTATDSQGASFTTIHSVDNTATLIVDTQVQITYV